MLWMYAGKDKQRSKLLASWFSTVFYQLECKACGNNSKGLRKLKHRDYEPLRVPLANAEDYLEEAASLIPILVADREK